MLQLARHLAPGGRGSGAATSGDLGLGVEQDAEDLGARGPVDGGVMELGQHRDATVAEAVDQVELPERMGAVQRAGDEPRDLLGQHPLVAGRGQRELADVEVEVEVRVVDPVGVVDPERHLGQAPAKRRQQVQPRGDQLGDRLERQLAAGRGGLVVDRQGADVGVVAAVLDRQELGVDAGQLLHCDPFTSGLRSSRRLDREHAIGELARGAPSCRTCRRSSSGSRSTNAKASGSCQRAKLGARGAAQLGRLDRSPCSSTTQASGRSLQRSSGIAITAASRTAGDRRARFSSSTEEIHSPPDLIRSLARSVRRTKPRASIAPMSPVRSQPVAELFVASPASPK